MKKFILLFILLYSATSVSAQDVNTNALQFDGSNDYVDFGTGNGYLYANQTNLTIEAWIKWEGSSSGNDRDDIVAWGSTAISNNAAELRLSNGKLQFGVGANWQAVTGSTTLTNTWTHVAIVKSSTAITLYVNGTQDGSGTISNTNNNFDKLIIGALYYSSAIQSDSYFSGTIDEVRIWNVSRSQSQIQTYMNKQINGSMSGLVASYHFNQGTASGTNTGVTTLNYDVGASSTYNGTLNNFALSGASSNWVSAGLTLPVTWQSFTATKQPTYVELNWSTASEQNTKDFEVQYSTNTQDWSSVGSVPASGNSYSVQEYSFIHYSPLKGSAHNYYRILQHDLDGKFSYSKIVSIIYNEHGPEVQFYPNPARGIINVYLAEPQQLRLVNMGGSIVWQTWMNSGRNTISLEHLPKGVYTMISLSGPQRLLIQ